MRNALEESLDEIIRGTTPECKSYRGRGERSGGNLRFRDHSRERAPKYRRDFRERDRCEPPRQTKIQKLSGGKAYLKISNLHYDITQDDLEQLFCTIGKTSFIDIQFKHGKSSGVAYVGFKDTRLNLEAVEKFDGRKAVGQHITVEEIKPLNIGLAPRSRNRDSEKGTRILRDKESPRHEKGPRKQRPKKSTAEDLDKELEDYMNRDTFEKESKRKLSGRPSAEDLDKELDDYMNKSFPAAS